jgi:hypothetical protein
LTKLELKPNVHFDEGTQDNTSINDFRDDNFSSYLLTNINNKYDSKGISSNSEAILRRKFGKKDRELEAKYILRYNDNTSDGQLVTNTNSLTFDTIIDQRKSNNNLSNTQYTTLTYTEPLSKSFLLTGFTKKHTSGIVFCTFQWVLLSEQHAIKELWNGVQEAQRLLLSWPQICLEPDLLGFSRIPLLIPALHIIDFFRLSLNNCLG